MLTVSQKKFYDDEGYLYIEDVISSDQLNNIMKVTNDLINSSRELTESNEIFDLEEGHNFSSPRLTRIKQPHKVNEIFFDIIKKSKIQEILIDLLGDNVSLKTSKLNTKFPDGGSAVEWHQDWVFYPHTNDNV